MSFSASINQNGGVSINDTEEGRAQNRRVELVLLPPEQQAMSG